MVGMTVPKIIKKAGNGLSLHRSYAFGNMYMKNGVMFIEEKNARIKNGSK